MQINMQIESYLYEIHSNEGMLEIHGTTGSPPRLGEKTVLRVSSLKEAMYAVLDDVDTRLRKRVKGLETDLLLLSDYATPEPLGD